MHALAAICFALTAFGLVVFGVRVRRLSRRLRANLAGCAGYPVLKSSRRPAYILLTTPVPLRAGKGRAAERSWCLS